MTLKKTLLAVGCLASTGCGSSKFIPDKVCFTEVNGSSAVMNCYDRSLNLTTVPIQDKYTCFSPDDAEKLQAFVSKCSRKK